MPQEGRKALVTGGAVRVGRAVSLELARAGYDVAVHYHTSGDAARKVSRRVEREGGSAAALSADLRDPDAATRLVREAHDALEGLHLLVNSAAIFPRAAPEEVTVEGWEHVFSLNARAPFLCAREAVRHMPASEGSVINIADVAAFEAWPGRVPYAATQAALVSLTRSLAVAWAPGVRVNAVAPGPVLLPEDADREERERAEASTALGRIGDPEDVAAAVLYLDRAGYVTGEVLRVDGGESVMRRSRDR